MDIERHIRWYQRPLAEYMMNGGKRAMSVAHRRWGKDEIAMAVALVQASKRPASYWHCLPEYEQARKALWTSVNAHTGKRRIDEAFPEGVRAKKDEQQMMITLRNGATWQLIGSDRFDATVGAGVAGITYSEWALANPSAWAYHKPMVEENDGWAMFITTPRGRNHAYDMFRMAQKDTTWFTEVSTVLDTGTIPAEQLGKIKAEYAAIYGEDVGNAQFEQEYLCSFNAAILGAFYAREMAAVRAEGRIARINSVPGKPVHTAWDIGVRDDTSIWWFQVVGSRVLVLDCYTNSGAGVDHYAEVCHDKPYRRGIDFVPHDARVKEWGSGRTRVEEMQRLGLNPRVVRNATKMDGIQAVRSTLPRCLFSRSCEDVGISALEQYRREWDDQRKTFRATEVHDWTSHLADAFRYLSLAWEEARAPIEAPKRPKPGPGQVMLPGPPRPNTGKRMAL